MHNRKRILFFPDLILRFSDGPLWYVPLDTILWQKYLFWHTTIHTKHKLTCCSEHKIITLTLQWLVKIQINSLRFSLNKTYTSE